MFLVKKNYVSFLSITSVTRDMQAERQASLHAKCPKLLSRLAMSKYNNKTRKHLTSKFDVLETVRHIWTDGQAGGRAGVAKQIGAF